MPIRKGNSMEQQEEVKERSALDIEIGTPCTLNYPQDRYGYVVVEISKNGKRALIERLSEGGLVVAGYCNSFPVFDHTYTPEECQSMRTGRVHAMRWTKRGWVMDGDDKSPITVGRARYFRNHAD